MPAKFLIRIREYPNTPTVDMWLIRQEGSKDGLQIESQMMHGQLVKFGAEEFVEAMSGLFGMPVEREKRVI